MTFITPTNSTLLLVRAAKFALDKLYREGYQYKRAGVMLQAVLTTTSTQTAYQYKRAGVMLSGLVQAAEMLPTLFDGVDHDKHRLLMLAMDQVNQRFGRNVVKTAGQTTGGVTTLTHQGKLSAAYTTRWKDVLSVETRRRRRI